MAKGESSPAGPQVYSDEEIARQIAEGKDEAAPKPKGEPLGVLPYARRPDNAPAIKITKRWLFWAAVVETLGLVLLIGSFFSGAGAPNSGLGLVLMLFVLPAAVAAALGFIWISYCSQLFLLDLLNRRGLRVVINIPLSIIGGPALAFVLLRSAMFIVRLIRG